jgi:four helix bundle protein
MSDASETPKENGYGRQKIGDQKSSGFDAWQKAMDLVVETYKVSRDFPKEELYGLTSQMRRAAVSVPANIAEGQGRRLSGEFIHFLGNARGSLLELDTHLEIALRLSYIEQKKYQPF